MDKSSLQKNFINAEKYGNRKSPLKHHSYNCYRQEPLMNAKISGQTLRKYRIGAETQNNSLKIFIDYNSFNMPISCDTPSLSRRWNLNPWVWAGLSNSLLMNSIWKGKNFNLTEENPGRHHLNQEIKVILTSNKPCWQLVLWICYEKGTSSLEYSFLKTHNPGVITRKTQTEGQFMK